jgi:uncharacterized protein YdbL (DUF1318 family)
MKFTVYPFAARNLVLLLIAAAGIFLWGFVNTARGDAAQDALKQRLAERHPQIRAAEDAGKIGETYDGLVEAVDPGSADAGLQKLVADEDADRKQVYIIIAQQTQTTPDVVAEREGARNFAAAHPGDYLKGKDGKWTRK